MLLRAALHGGEQRCQRLLRPLRPQPRGVENLDALLSKGRYLTGDKVATFKAILERYLPKFSKGGKTQVHEDDLGLIEEDTGTICEKCATKLGERLRERKTEPVAERERFV